MSDVVVTGHAEQALRLREVQARVGQVSKSTLYAWVQQGNFPAPLKIGPDKGVSVWLASDVDSWLQKQVRTARGESEASRITAGAA